MDWINNYNLLIFETLDSTNTEALRLAKVGISHNLVVTTEHQTAGRGSRGRTWASLPGNLHASILLNIGSGNLLNSEVNTQLSFVIACALHEALNTLAEKQGKELNMSLKWPNDVLIDQKKVAGILIESISSFENNYVVIGFGVNVKTAPLPQATTYETTSLEKHGVVFEHHDPVLQMIMSKFNKLYTEWGIDNNFSSIKKDWLKNAYKLGEEVTIDNGVSRTSGVFKTIDNKGAMILEIPGGAKRSILSGDFIG